jgi:hypothetical protein
MAHQRTFEAYKHGADTAEAKRAHLSGLARHGQQLLCGLHWLCRAAGGCVHWQIANGPAEIEAQGRQDALLSASVNSSNGSGDFLHFNVCARIRSHSSVTTRSVCFVAPWA